MSVFGWMIILREHDAHLSHVRGGQGRLKAPSRHIPSLDQTFPLRMFGDYASLPEPSHHILFHEGSTRRPTTQPNIMCWQTAGPDTEFENPRVPGRWQTNSSRTRGQLQVAIIGGGPAGLGAAVELAKLPFVRLCLYEQKPCIMETGGGISLHANVWRLLKNNGAAENIGPDEFFKPPDGDAEQKRYVLDLILIGAILDPANGRGGMGAQANYWFAETTRIKPPAPETSGLVALSAPNFKQPFSRLWTGDIFASS